MNKITIPAFTTDQLRVDSAHKFDTSQEIFVESIKAAIVAYDEISDGDVVVVFIKEKIQNDQHRMGIACIPLSCMENIGCIAFPNFTSIKEIFVSTKYKVKDVIERIIKNIAFT